MEVIVNGQRYTGDSVAVSMLPRKPVPEADQALLKKNLETMTESLKRAENRHMDASASDDTPEKAVKEIVVNGKVAATIYVTGVVSMPLEFGQRLGGDLPRGAPGRETVMMRAEFIANALGGQIRDVVKSKSPSSTSSPPSFSTFSSSSPSISRFRVT